MGTRMWMPDIAMDQATIDTVSKKWDEAYKLLGINPINLSSDSGRA